MNELTVPSAALIKFSIFASVLSFFEYVGVPKEPFTILGILMMVDMVSGVAKQYVINKKDITSHKAWLGLIRKVMTLTAILSVALAIKGLGFNGTTLITLTIAGFISAELYSVIQNIFIFRTGKHVPEFDATSFVFKILMKALRSRMETEAKQFETINAEDKNP